MKKNIKIFLMCALVCFSLCSCSDEDINSFLDNLQEEIQEIGNNEDYSDSENEETKTLFYSTNDYDTATKGNSGVFSYKNKDGSYDVYWIINFDDGYVYYFTNGNGNSSCDKVKIASGDLNDRITITWGDSGEEWYLHFKYVNHPQTLIVNDHFGYSVEFTTTDLDKALEIRESKTITEY